MQYTIITRQAKPNEDRKLKRLLKCRIHYDKTWVQCRRQCLQMPDMDQNRIYEYPGKNQTEAFVNYNNFRIDQSQKWKGDPHRMENPHYNKELNCFYCPMGQTMKLIGLRTDRSALGCKRHYKQYQAKNSNGWPMQAPCCEGSGNRIISVNHQWNE